MHRREDLEHLVAGQRLVLEQLQHEIVQHVPVLDQDLPRLVVSRLDEPAHLVIDGRGNLLGIVARMRHLPAEERLTVAGAELPRAQALAHAVLDNHAARDGRRLLDVVGRARGRLVEDQFLGRPAAQQHRQLVHHLGTADQEFVLRRRGGGVPECAAARDDRNLVHRVGVGHRVAHQGVPALVVSDDLALLLRQQHALALRTRSHPVNGLLERGHLDLRLVRPRGQQGALVDHIRQVRAGEPGGSPRDHVQIHVRVERLAPRVHSQDALTAGQVRLGDDDLPVEPARAQQRRVEDVGPVRRRDDDDAALGVEAIELDQQLVQRLLTLVVAATEARTAVPAHGIDLIHEHDGGRVGLGLLEQVANPGGTDADEHLDEVRAGDGVERHARLASDGPGQQRLTSSRRAVQQHTLGNLGADRLELARALQELLDLLELLDGFVSACHVPERGLRGVLGDQLGLRLAEVHDPRAAALHLVQEHHEQQEDDQEWQVAEDQRPERAALRHLHGVDAGRQLAALHLLLEGVGKLSALEADPGRFPVGVVLRGQLDGLVDVGQRDRLHVARVDRRDRLRGGDQLVRRPRTDQLVQDHKDDGDKEDGKHPAAENALQIHR